MCGGSEGQRVGPERSRGFPSGSGTDAELASGRPARGLLGSDGCPVPGAAADQAADDSSLRRGGEGCPGGRRAPASENTSSTATRAELRHQEENARWGLGMEEEIRPRWKELERGRRRARGRDGVREALPGCEVPSGTKVALRGVCSVTRRTSHRERSPRKEAKRRGGVEKRTKR